MIQLGSLLPAPQLGWARAVPLKQHWADPERVLEEPSPDQLLDCFIMAQVVEFARYIPLQHLSFDSM